MNTFLGLEKGRWRSAAAWLSVGTGIFAGSTYLAALLKILPALDPAPLDTVYDAALVAELNQRADLAAAPQPPMTITVDGLQEQISDCQDFLWLIRYKSVRPLMVANPASAGFAECAPVELLSHARRPKNFLAPQDELGKLLADRLDVASLDDGVVASLLPGSLADSLGGNRLAALPAGQVQVEPRAVTVTTPAATWRFEAVASVNFDRKGLERLLLRVTRRDADPAQPRGVGYAVLRQGEDGRLHAQPVETLDLPTSNLPWWASGGLVS